MCGIAGTLTTDGAVEQDRLKAAAVLLEHRGPDASAVWTNGPVGLAHTRLAIIDRAGGSQPMMSSDGRYVVVFNGEIYNHRALREDLRAKGHRPMTRCDTEVLLALYEERGSQMVDDLRGMFAFAIADLQGGTVFLARDRFGKKPLYYRADPRGLSFASTLDALRSLLDSSCDLDHQAIAEYLVLQYVPGPLTPWQGVRKLLPGHAVEWSATGLVERRYWEPPIQEKAEGSMDAETMRRDVRAHIRDAVEVRLESEVPLGVFLSGGMDSSVVVAEMVAAGVRPATYSIGFRDERFDESRYASMVAKHFDTDHRTLQVEADVTALFADLAQAYDEPFADSSALVTLAVARAASPHVTVVLTGDGGDELFGGYDRYRVHAMAEASRRYLGPVASPMARAGMVAAGVAGLHRIASAGGAIRDPWGGYRDRMFHFSPEEVATLLRPEVARSVDLAAPVARLDALWQRSHGWVPWVDAQTYLVDDLLTKMDRATMAVGVETRAPLLDQELWAYVATLPRSALFGPRRGKRILRDAYRRVLPAVILTRPKMGFGVPLQDWMRSQLSGEIDELLVSGDGPLQALVRRDRVEDLVGRFRTGDGTLMYPVWNLLALANWMRARGEPIAH